ncbi:MAG: LysR family transcriptional regulator [Burkholderiales bacterium]|nr:LysR family transcriptional regulator [Burkholderiales bacterium]
MATLPGTDFKLLRIFASVARNQGFARAQQELNLTTSAISTYMTQLEAQVGFSLCRRGRGGFALTPKGELLLSETLRLFGELEGFERYAMALKGDLGGTLKIGVIDTTVTDPALPLATAIGVFSGKYPGMHLSLLIRSPYELQKGLLENELDMAVGFFPAKANGLIYHPLYREQQWLYCSDRHPCFHQRAVKPAFVSELNVVSRSYWSQTELGRHGFKRSVATVESMEAQLILILSGGYIGYLPEHYAQSWVEQGRLKVLLPAEFGYQSQFSLVYRRGRSRELPLQAMRELLQPGKRVAKA